MNGISSCNCRTVTPSKEAKTLIFLIRIVQLLIVGIGGYVYYRHLLTDATHQSELNAATYGLLLCAIGYAAYYFVKGFFRGKA